MTQDQVIKAVENYERILSEVACSPEDKPYIEHAIEMCPKTINHMIEGKIEKAMRWLGFIQGVMWKTGIRTIDEMKEDNN